MNPKSAKLPTIIDNRQANTTLAVLQKLLLQCIKADVATGTFEIGSLLALDGITCRLECLLEPSKNEVLNRDAFLAKENNAASIR